MKKPYFLVYDYGMGGAWAIMAARSEAEIEYKYPEVKVLHDRPKWMGDDTYANLLSTSSYDIDNEPYGWLEVLVSQRT